MTPSPAGPPSFIKLDPTDIQRQMAQGPATVQQQTPSFIKLDQPVSPGQAVYSPPGGAQGQRPFTDKLLDFVRPLVQGGVTLGGTALATADPFNAGPIGAPAVGMGLGVAADMGLQNLYKTPPVSYASQWAGFEPGSFASQLTNAGTQGLGNEVGGRIMGGLLKGAKNVFNEFTNPGAVVGDIYKLNPTFSQYYTNMFGKRPISKWVEDVFASGSKAAAMENSATTAQAQGGTMAQQLSGRSVEDLSSPETMGKFVRQAAQSNFKRSLAASNREAQTVLFGASSNVKQFQGSLTDAPEYDAFARSLTGKGASQLTPQESQAVLQTMQKAGIQAPIREVEGPIQLTNTVGTAQKFLEQKAKLWGDLTKAPVSDQPLITAAQNLVKASNAKFQNGQLLSSDPVSFQDAWDFKKVADAYGWGERSAGDATNPVFRDSNFKSIAKGINDDITNGIQQWQNNPSGLTLEAWRNTKAIVAERHALFDEDGLRQLIQTNNDAIPEVDRILADPKKLQRALNAGELDLKGGLIASTNMRQDLQGYSMTKFMQPPYFNGDAVTGKGLFNGDKLMKDWKDPASQDIYGKLFSQQQRADIDHFFTNIVHTQDKMTSYGTSGLKMWAMRGGIMVTPALVTGSLTGSAAYGGSVAGVIMGGMAMSKLLTNPKTARMMASLAAGEASPATNVISREIVGALQGTGAVITMQRQDGTKIPGTIDKDGKFEPLSNR